MEKYVGIKAVEAEKCPCAKDVYKSKVGDDGYKVVYENGYESWSPADIFENSYRPAGDTVFGIGIAIGLMKSGCKVARKGWNGKGIFIELQCPDKHSKMTSPYIYIDTTGLQTDNESAPKSLVPWLASQTDLLAEDWEIVG